MALHNFTFGQTPVESAQLNGNGAFFLNQVLFLSADAGRTTNDAEGYLVDSYEDIVTVYTTARTNKCFIKNPDSEVYLCEIMDDCADGSVDANVWSTSTTGIGTVTEDSTGLTGVLNVATNGAGGPSTAIAIADQVNALDLKAADCEVIINLEGNKPGVATTELILTDGSNDVVIENNLDFGVGVRKTIRIVVDVASETLDYYDDIDTVNPTTDNLDISSLVGSNWYLKFKVTNAGSDTGQIQIYEIGFTIGGESCTYETAAQSITDATSGFVQVDDINDFATITSVALSFNNGSNFVSLASQRLILSTSNNGTNLIMKCVATLPAIDNTAKNIARLGVTKSLQILYG